MSFQWFDLVWLLAAYRQLPVGHQILSVNLDPRQHKPSLGGWNLSRKQFALGNGMPVKLVGLKSLSLSQHLAAFWALAWPAAQAVTEIKATMPITTRSNVLPNPPCQYTKHRRGDDDLQNKHDRLCGAMISLRFQLSRPQKSAERTKTRQSSNQPFEQAAIHAGILPTRRGCVRSRPPVY